MLLTAFRLCQFLIKKMMVITDAQNVRLNVLAHSHCLDAESWHKQEQTYRQTDTTTALNINKKAVL